MAAVGGEVYKAASEQYVFKVVALKAGEPGKCKDLGDSDKIQIVMSR